MVDFEFDLIGLAVALGVGLLVGVEREHTQRSTATGAVAGVRTFALVALLGAIAALFESDWVLIAFGLVVGGVAALSYRATLAADPGITTEFALVVVYLLGAVAMRNAPLATGLGVTVAVLLRSRSWLHDWVRNRLTAHEVDDALLLAASALVILPLIPDRTVDPWQILNPRTIWLLAVIFMAINGLGYIARRGLGTVYGLAVAGLASGFVSSAATHAAMGSRSKAQPQLLGAAVAGAALSSIATIIQLTIVIGVTSPELLRALGWSLALSGLVAVIYGAAFMRSSLRHDGVEDAEPGRAFRPRTAIGFALLMSAVIVGSALLVRWLGAQGALLASAIAGFADTHSSAASAGMLLDRGFLQLSDAAVAVLLGLTTNAITKALAAAGTGGKAFLLRLLPGLVLMVAAAWLGQFLSR